MADSRELSKDYLAEYHRAAKSMLPGGWHEAIHQVALSPSGGRAKKAKTDAAAARGEIPGGGEPMVARGGPAVPPDMLSSPGQAIYKSADLAGAMIALFPSPEAAQALSWQGKVDGAEPTELLHLTIAYLGKATELTDDEVSTLQDLVADFATEQWPVSAEVTGIGRFTAGEDEHCVVALIDGQDLGEFRQDLLADLDDADIVSPSEHGFLPHIALTYTGAEEATPGEPIEAGALLFDHVSLVIGGQRMDFPLTGDPAGVEEDDDEEDELDDGDEHEEDEEDEARVTILVKSEEYADGELEPLAKSWAWVNAHKQRGGGRHRGHGRRRGHHARARHARKSHPRALHGKPKHSAVRRAAFHRNVHVAAKHAAVFQRNVSSSQVHNALMAATAPTALRKGEGEMVEFEMYVPITKAEAPRRLVTGLVMVPGVEDSWGDIPSVDEIELTAHAFMREYRAQGIEHGATATEGISVVESWIAPTDLVLKDMEGEDVPVPRGTWLMTSHVGPDEAWQAIEKRELTGFSMQGWGLRTPVVAA